MPSLTNRYNLNTYSKEYGPQSYNPAILSVHLRANQSHRSHALLARAAP